MTTANKITILRILLVPFFVVQVLYYADTGNEWYRISALVSFAFAAISDGVDGYIARRYNQRSELGAVLDPLADKLLLVSGVLLLSMNNAPHLPRIPVYVTAIIISRDVLLIIGLVVIHLVCGKVTFHPIWTSKIATVLQMATVLWILLKWNPLIFNWCAALTALTTGISGVLYVLVGIRHLSASPSSAPSPRP